MKTFIKTLYADEDYEAGQRDSLREKLNADGFYVLTGAGDSLQVYALAQQEYFEQRVVRVLVEFFRKVLR